MKSEGLLSIDEAAAWLGVSYSTVTRLMRAGDLRYVRVASIPVEELRRFSNDFSNAHRPNGPSR